MAINDKLSEEFLQGLEDVEKLLSALRFKPYSFDKKGYAYFVQYKRENNIVKFLFGPSDYEAEMIIYTSKGKFDFKDLLQLPAIEAWVNENKFLFGNQKNLRNDMLWLFELLKFSLPLID